MKETFILANGLSRNEFCRSLAKLGVNSFGLRIINSVELAQEVLLRCGVVLNKTYINNVEQCAIVYSYLNEIKYFKHASYTDACNLVDAFHVLRTSIVEGDELDEIRSRMEKGTFKNKNEAVVEAYVRYSNYIYQNDLIDGDGIIREAVNCAKPMDSDFVSLKEYELNPLEQKLLDVVSAGKTEEKSVIDFYKTKEAGAKFVQASKAYGTINEVENIIEDIYKNHKLDECVIACTNIKAYSQLIYNLSLQYKIPATFANGISINNSNPAKLLTALEEWDNLGHNGVDALYSLLKCEALDWRFFAPAIGVDADVKDDFIRKLSEYAGNLKISTEEKSNILKLSKLNQKDEMYEHAFKLAKIFEKGIIEFLKTFVLIRDENTIDQIALDGIVSELEIFEKYNPDKLMAEVIPKITNASVGGQLSTEGHIHVTSLKGLFSQGRKYVYICGLSANEFPGSAKENYLLLDSDLQNFDSAKQSSAKVLDNIKLFDDVLNFLSHFGYETKFSYSYFNLADLKDQNASSVVNKFSDNIDGWKTVNYFDSRLSQSYEICNSYINGVDVKYEVEPPKPKLDKHLLDRAWSFSAINTYFTCPRKFYLRYVLEVPEIETCDPFEVLNAKDFGTLAHKMMEILGKEKISKDEFLQICAKAFDDYLIAKPALIKTKKESVKQEFLDTMSNAYEFDQTDKNKVEISEEYMEAKHEATGVLLHGFPDRIETDEENVCVVDFKTGRDIKHKQNDPESCLQALIYAYVYQKNHPEVNVSRAEFRYLRNSGVVSCQFDDESKEKMNELLNKFVDGISQNNFERCNKKCDFCTYRDICLWPGEIDDENEESNG